MPDPFIRNGKDLLGEIEIGGVDLTGVQGKEKGIAAGRRGFPVVDELVVGGIVAQPGVASARCPQCGNRVRGIGAALGWLVLDRLDGGKRGNEVAGLVFQLPFHRVSTAGFADVDDWRTIHRGPEPAEGVGNDGIKERRGVESKVVRVS